MGFGWERFGAVALKESYVNLFFCTLFRSRQTGAWVYLAGFSGFKTPEKLMHLLL